MCADEQNHESFDDMFRSMAEEFSRSIEHTMENLDVEGIAGSFGVDPMQAREWVDTAGRWIRSRAESFGDEVSSRTPPQREPAPTDDPLRNAEPNPLDVPTDEQGRALAALDSGRWTLEPGSETLAVHGDGPGPSDALGLVRELRVRDWIATDGRVTLAGRHALKRWLDAVEPH